MAFMRSSLAGDRKIDLGFKNIESITIEIRTETDVSHLSQRLK
jgi:hypothetical protein